MHADAAVGDDRDVARRVAGAAAQGARRERAAARTQGRPLFGVEMRIVDDDGNVLPNDGESVGEFEVRGPWITGSYYRDRDAEKFADGWVRTGDVGRIDSLGYVTLTDRAKDVIKSGGEWISSVELENHLMGHPDVLEAAVVGVPDERWQERPLAAVVLKESATVTAPAAAGLPARQGGSVVASRALGVRRRGATHQRRQVRQEGDPVPLRRRHLRRRLTD